MVKSLVISTKTQARKLNTHSNLYKLGIDSNKVSFCTSFNTISDHLDENPDRVYFTGQIRQYCGFSDSGWGMTIDDPSNIRQTIEEKG